MNYSSDFKKITLPFDRKTLDSLNAGDYLLLSGTLYTGRDAAHKRLCETISRGDALPVDLKGQAINPRAQVRQPL